jgi:tRNA nucleotidyltransferase (CCA-adding enzyme)
MADRPVMSGDDPFEGDSDFLFERYRIFKETMAKPFVQGRDLIEAGLEPGSYFTELLEYAHKLRLAGIDKDMALKQTLSYARSEKLV